MRSNWTRPSPSNPPGKSVLRQRRAVSPERLLQRARPARCRPPISWRWKIRKTSSTGIAPTSVLVLDGRGERASHLAGRYRGGRLEVLASQELPHSLGLLYESVTEHLGFLRSSDEYKVMALASYGTPRHLEELRELAERLEPEEGRGATGGRADRRALRTHFYAGAHYYRPRAGLYCRGL